MISVLLYLSWAQVPCPAYVSAEEEFAPIQTAAAGLPSGTQTLPWRFPCHWIYTVAFSGTPGYPADHEGVDYVFADAGMAQVDISAASTGVVVYVRLGCPQSHEFTPNQSLRECGAGWGNHVVIDHGNGIFTRYAHLKPDSTLVRVGDRVWPGQVLALMGNSGRSQLRHLHFELGFWSQSFDSCAPAQSMDQVHDPQLLPLMPPCPGDFNFDRWIDAADREILQADWPLSVDHPETHPVFDLNQSGTIDLPDLILLMNRPGPCGNDFH